MIKESCFKYGLIIGSIFTDDNSLKINYGFLYFFNRKLIEITYKSIKNIRIRKHFLLLPIYPFYIEITYFDKKTLNKFRFQPYFFYIPFIKHSYSNIQDWYNQIDKKVKENFG
jgi:hypothetical protein